MKCPHRKASHSVHRRIHRFNRSQQDALLPDVESGVVTLVGATTSNPFFSVNGALLSRSQIFQFEPLSSDDIQILLERAISDRLRGFGYMEIIIDPEAMQFLTTIVEGDARKALGALEIAVLSSRERPFELLMIWLASRFKRKRFNSIRRENNIMTWQAPS